MTPAVLSAGLCWGAEVVVVVVRGRREKELTWARRKTSKMRELEGKLQE